MNYNKRTVETTPKIKIGQFSDLKAVGYMYGVKTGITYPHFGGERYWFICKNCNKRTATLYQVTTGQPLHCRICSELSYASQGFSGSSRLFMRVINHMNRQEAVFSGLKRIKVIYKGRLTKRMNRFLKYKALVERWSQLIPA